MFKRIITAIREDILWRNIVLAVCGIIIFIFLSNLLLKTYTRHGQKYQVPNFTGMTLPEARKAAKTNKLVLEVIDSLYLPNQTKGVVLEQYPKAGNNVKSGRRIFLTVNSFRPRMIEIPYVTGLSLRQAYNRLQTNGLVVERLIYKSDIATNNVIEQRYGEQIIRSDSKVLGEMGSGVILIVGSNPTDPPPIVPNVIGMTIDQAKAKLWETGFNVGEVQLDNSVNYENLQTAKIFEQSPNQVARSHYGKTVDLKATVFQQKINEGLSASEREAGLYLRTLRSDSLPQQPDSTANEE